MIGGLDNEPIGPLKRPSFEILENESFTALRLGVVKTWEHAQILLKRQSTHQNIESGCFIRRRSVAPGRGSEGAVYERSCPRKILSSAKLCKTRWIRSPMKSVCFQRAAPTRHSSTS